MDKSTIRVALILMSLAGILMSGSAFAVDGDYSAPYASQWVSGGQSTIISTETMFGALLLTLNLMTAVILSHRYRKRQRSKG